MNNLRFTEEQLASALCFIRKDTLPLYSYLAPPLFRASRDKPDEFEHCDCCKSIKHEYSMYYIHCCTLKHCKNLIKKHGIDSGLATVIERTFKDTILKRLKS